MNTTTSSTDATLAQLTAENFEAFLAQSERPVLVEFGAAWCGPCRMQAPILKELVREFGDTAHIGAIDVDAVPEIAARYGIRSLPTLAFFRSGQLRRTLVGLTDKATLAAELRALN